MAECKPAQALSEKSLFIQLAQLEHPAFLLCLDGVQDPHNLGACLRSADAAGVDAVIVPKDNACGLNATVSKVASGAAESMPFFAVTNLSRCLREIQQAGIWCVGLAAEAVQSLYTSDLSGPVAIVLGAEGKGLRRLTAQTCDSLVSLPMLGQVSSLNVSVTTGIALFEAVRQRQCG
jgi:23S rRNA (guanosine2251-2'-O)-methyltransferase